MREVVAYLAMSLDGYIADRFAGVSWLEGDGSDRDNPGSYPAFYETVDCIVMGYRTYHQIVTQLSPGSWPYPGKACYVVTHRRETPREGIQFVNSGPAELVGALKGQPGRDIWICGGASIVNQLMEEELIDRYHLTVIPTILGGGVRLFEQRDRQRTLRLMQVQVANGMVDLVYRPRA